MPIPAKFPPDIVAAARASATRWGIPASVSLAQWALESAWGKAMPKGSNNPFGIKAKAGDGVSAATHEEVDGRLVPAVAWFRRFASLDEAFDAHAKLLATGRPYARAFALLKAGATIPVFVTAFAPRYATDSKYATKLLSIIHVNDLAEADLPLAAPQKGPSMAPTTKPAAPIPSSPDILGTIKGMVEGIIGKLQILPTVLNAAPQIASGAIRSAGDIETAIGQLLEVTRDIETGKWGEVPRDIEDLAKTIARILETNGVNLGGLTSMVAKLPELPAIG